MNLKAAWRRFLALMSTDDFVSVQRCGGGKAGQEMSGHQNPMIAVLALRGFRGDGAQKTSLNVNPL